MPYPSLDKILNDPFLIEYVNELKEPKKVESTDPDVEHFLEIIEWMKDNNQKIPEKNRANVKEWKIATKLDTLKNNPEVIQKLKPYDTFNILGDPLMSMDEILDDELFKEPIEENSLFDTSRYQDTIAVRDRNQMRTRKKISRKEFKKYNLLFKQVHKEIGNGLRQIVKPDTENNIDAGKFYIDNGVMLYVANKGSFYIDKNGHRNADLHIIYENGTENKNALLRSIASNLFDKSRDGRMVTELTEQVIENGITIHNKENYVEEQPEEFNYKLNWKEKVKNNSDESPTDHNITTGYIYAVRSLSDSPQIRELSDLYKVGFTKNSVEKRVAHAEKEPAYLYAPVEIVATWKVQNINARKLETAIHHYFSDKVMDIVVIGADGRDLQPKEWILATLEDIKIAIEEIIELVNNIPKGV